ncbi:hypothetical protein DEO72_LG7g2573 [Vigna unguiculata]|uniref:Uncharacterized protein n=1 Tax=Vigna unguiculata TaxID=3917 RepID=A0A4D6MMS6_VIGUN|nr:hypothetical protein DEO72_LG7g2573 [Vigna unguiculata]
MVSSNAVAIKGEKVSVYFHPFLLNIDPRLWSSELKCSISILSCICGYNKK